MRSIVPAEELFLVVRHVLTRPPQDWVRAAPSESYGRAYDVDCRIEFSTQFVSFGYPVKSTPGSSTEQMRVADIEIHELSGRTTYSGGKK